MKKIGKISGTLLRTISVITLGSMASSALALTMTVVDYPYVPTVVPPLPAGVGGGLPSLAINESGSVGYTVTTDLYEPNQLYSINPATGAGTRIAESGNDHDIDDLAIQPGTGILFGTYRNQLHTINTTTGAVTDISGALPGGGQGNPNGPTGLAFAPDGTLYFLRGGNLYTLNPVTGAVLTTTPVLSGPGIRWMGLGIQPGSGTLYAASLDNVGGIYTIDPVTGTATLVDNVTNLGCSGSCSLHDLAFDPSGNVMYGVMGGSGESEDPADLPGAFVRFGDLPTEGIPSDALPATAVPTLPIYGLAMTMLGLLLLAGRRLTGQGRKA